MKRFLVLFLVLSMLLAGISAAFAQDAPAEIVVPEGRILVKYWSPYGSGSSAWIDENAINVFNAAQDKYFVVREYNGGYYDQIAKLMATEQKDLPAFCNSSSETVGSYLHSGIIIPIQEFIDADPTYEDPHLYGNIVATYGYNGKMVGYPVALSLSGFWYNKAVFEAAGIDPYSLTSFDRVYEAAIAICEGGFAKYGVGEEHSGIWANYAFAREGFDTVDNANGLDGLPTKCLYDDNSNGFADIVTNYYSEWADLANKGFVYPIGAKIKDEMIPALAAGDLAMLITTNSYLANILDAFGEDSDNFAFVPMFSATDNGAQTSYCSSGNGFFIVDNGDPEAQQGAWEYIKFWNSPEIQTAWNMHTGYLPTYPALNDVEGYSEFLEKYPFVKYAIDAMANSGTDAHYAFTATNNVYTVAGATALEAVCNGTPVDEAIATMVETINDSFEMYNLTNGF